MKRKYMMIFLMGLLCLVSNEELFSQHCLKMHYDKNGNRIGFSVGECVKDWRGLVDNNDVEEKIGNMNKDITVAIMGCAVNGPGEAREADIGIAGGKGEGLLFKKGEIVRKIKGENLVKELLDEIDKY